MPRPETLGRLAAPAADRVTARLFAEGVWTDARRRRDPGDDLDDRRGSHRRPHRPGRRHPLLLGRVGPGLRRLPRRRVGLAGPRRAALFERFTLEAFQSGLSWITILRKRAAFRAAFAGFDADGSPPSTRRPRPADGRRRHRAQPPQGRGCDRQRPRRPRPARGRRSRRLSGRSPPSTTSRPRSTADVRADQPRVGGARQGAEAARASSSSGRPRRMRRCRPAAWSTTTSRAASARPGRDADRSG